MLGVIESSSLPQAEWEGGGSVPATGREPAAEPGTGAGEHGGWRADRPTGSGAGVGSWPGGWSELPGSQSRRSPQPGSTHSWQVSYGG